MRRKKPQKLALNDLSDLTANFFRFIFRSLLRLASYTSLENLTPLLRRIPLIFVLIQLIDNACKLVYELAYTQNRGLKLAFKVFVPFVGFSTACLSLFLFSLAPIFAAIGLFFTMTNKLADIFFNKLENHPEKILTSIHKFFIAAVMLAGAVMLLTPLASIGEVTLIGITLYSAIDTLGVNPLTKLINWLLPTESADFDSPQIIQQPQPEVSQKINTPSKQFDQPARERFKAPIPTLNQFSIFNKTIPAPKESRINKSFELDVEPRLAPSF